MLVRAINESLIHFREGHDNLVLLNIRDRFIEDNSSVELSKGLVKKKLRPGWEKWGYTNLANNLGSTPPISHKVRNNLGHSLIR